MNEANAYDLKQVKQMCFKLELEARIAQPAEIDAISEFETNNTYNTSMNNNNNIVTHSVSSTPSYDRATYKHKSVQRLVRLNKPLKYAVYCGSTCVIPRGAVGVAIRYRASHLHRFDEKLQREVPLNVYYYRGKIYHA